MTGHQPHDRSRGHAYSIGVILVAMIFNLTSAVARAAPPTDEPAVSADDAEKIARAQALFGEGEAALKLGDFETTIERWEQAYISLPTSMAARSMRADLQVSLADVHMRAHERDRDPIHLRAARQLYTDYLADLDGGDSTRVAVEAELTKVEVALGEALAAAAEQERRVAAAAQAAAQAATQAEMKEQQRIAERVEASAEATKAAAKEQRRYKAFVGSGAALTGAGILSSSAMVAGLALGAEVERRGETADANPDTPPGDFQALLHEGTTYNRVAWSTGVIGGALLVSGVTLVIVATIRHERARSSRRAQLRRPTRPTPELRSGPRGIEVRF